MGNVDSWCAEPPGERYAQPERGGVGGIVDGCGPGDVGVGADQDGIRRSVIGFGGVDVDARLPPEASLRCGSVLSRSTAW
jgi:hypothetical protein